MKLESLKESFGSLWDNLAEGWHHLTQTAAGALTRFKPGEDANLPGRSEVENSFYLPTQGWAMLGGDVFEDEKHVVVRLEVPGMEKQEINLEVRDDALVVCGEKRFDRESTEGRWRVMQCAYGNFRRVLPLPAPVVADQAKATYKNGVLRVDLPKATPGKPKSFTITVE
ncbi:Hsp20/alpha crystallin family protein [Cupriavidus sp. D39]|uniref:Hsp20/alpha crystallin family protein n=1 Tax=Cupriavidus sp. D39 TaxID=2997877 RepID=UPI002270BCDF|nr:Hsp20/alpha crystallin family protein [Cupriavidus sp. D39]MCY0852944.1 Hsp20/alpha crystallin family protein [Cupriavidus sp. D39]